MKTLTLARYEFLLASSCKTWYFCPSCHQKLVLPYGEWVEQNVLAPVAHRQYVVTARSACFNPHLHVLAADGVFTA